MEIRAVNIKYTQEVKQYRDGRTRLEDTIAKQENELMKLKQFVSGKTSK